MGNCFSCQLSGGDALVERCWDCIALRCNNLRRLDSNLQKLHDERDYLRTVKDQVKQKVSHQQGPQMKQLDVVRVWVSKVEDKLAEVDSLVTRGETEKNNLRLGGYCSKTCCSSYNLATLIAESLTDVIALKERGNFEVVVDRVVAEPEYISQLEKDLVELRAANEELKALKNDVIRRVNAEEGPQIRQLDRVKVWISRVDVIIPECDSLMRDGPQELQRLRSGDLSFSDFGERVAKALTHAMAEIQKGVFEAVVGRVPIEPVVERPGEQIVGLESSIEKVWNWLMEENIGVIGIYGMGGIGKTTLLTEINNRFSGSLESINFVIWAVASKDLRPHNLQEDIANRIGLSMGQWKERQFSEKATILHRALQKKKFILLIDDLWNRVDLKAIGVPFPNKENKSKVVFTTRSMAVCGKMEAQRSILLDPLPWGEAWKLFEEKVGREAIDADVDIPDLAKDVAKECAGLPLALVTVGRAMANRKTPQEWKHALQILKTPPSTFRGMEDDIFPKLKFSYDYLPNEKVKSCLLYCSLFPEDYLIRKDELIQKWFCENFWGDDTTSQIDPINEGYYIIATLVHACLLEDKGEHVKMHDVIRDMCLWIACEVEKEKENFFVRAGGGLKKAPTIEKWAEVKRISLMKNLIEQLAEVPETSSMLTLFLNHNIVLKTIGDGFFRHMKALRVLDLSNTGITFLPTGIELLVSLRYLDISATKIVIFPWELTTLKKIKFLNLDFMDGLKEVPKPMISSFPSLHVIRMRAHCIYLERSMVEELESLEYLKELSTKIRDWTVLHQLLKSRTLSSCIRYLGIYDLNYSSSSTKEQDREKDVFGALIGRETHRFGGLHKILEKMCFGNLQKVDVSRCYLQDLTWLSLAPNLTELKAFSVNGLEEIISYKKLGGVADQSENLNLFTRLQVLSLVGLPELKCIWVKPLLLPSLNKISIYGCPMLKKLPLNSESAKGDKLVIEGRSEWWNGLEWEDDAAHTVFASCFRESLVRSSRKVRSEHIQKTGSRSITGRPEHIQKTSRPSRTVRQLKRSSPTS